MSSPGGQTLRLGKSFSTEIIVILSLLITAFTPLIQHPVLTPLWHSIIMSIYCVMMMLCAVTLVAIISLRGGEDHSNLDTHHYWSEILQTIAFLTGSLAVISLISINKPYIALFWLLVWFLFAAYRIRILIRDSNRQSLPISNNAEFNSNCFTTIVGEMKIRATKLFQWCATKISVVCCKSMCDPHISDRVQQANV